MKFVEKIKKVGLFQAVDDSIGNFFSYFKYLVSLLNKKTYFGSYLASKQGKTVRHYFMQKLVENYCKNLDREIKILEIGSWAGGSAITWVDALEKYSQKKGMLLCLDQWRDYLNPIDKKWTQQTMKKALRANKIFNLFLHNIAVSKCGDSISIFKVSSLCGLSMLRDDLFDIIFIDGSHYYKDAYSDIKKSAPLLKEGGVLCGDDLELQFHSVDQNSIKKFLNYDVIVDYSTNKNFHPGVTLAVWEYFKSEVSCWEGFWAMRKKIGKWEKIILEVDQVDPKIPEHLK